MRRSVPGGWRICRAGGWGQQNRRGSKSALRASVRNGSPDGLTPFSRRGRSGVQRLRGSFGLARRLGRSQRLYRRTASAPALRTAPALRLAPAPCLAAAGAAVFFFFRILIFFMYNICIYAFCFHASLFLLAIPYVTRLFGLLFPSPSCLYA